MTTDSSATTHGSEAVEDTAGERVRVLYRDKDDPSWQCSACKARAYVFIHPRYCSSCGEPFVDVDDVF